MPEDAVMLKDAPTIPIDGIKARFNPMLIKAAVPDEYITTGGIPIEAK